MARKTSPSRWHAGTRLIPDDDRKYQEMYVAKQLSGLDHTFIISCLESANLFRNSGCDSGLSTIKPILVAIACIRQVARYSDDSSVQHVEIIPTEAETHQPVVYADWLHSEGQPTVLIYGHYDVQPAEDVELWDSPPFEAYIKDG